MQSISYVAKGIFSIVHLLKLLKVLDVLSVWDDFSWVIPQLVHLRYVAARIKGALSLAKLRNLQSIILSSYRREGLKGLILQSHEERKLKSIPVDIWIMSEIRHVDIGRPLYICNPVEAANNSIGEQPLFPNNLQTLSLSNCPFVAEIIRRTPNLKQLKIFYESKHPDIPAVLDSLNILEKLETLYLAEATIDRMIFPSNLKELKLVSTCMPWEVVNLLANLPNLEVLKGYYAFDGTDWKLNEDVVFHKLKYLQVVGADLERWEAAGSDNFPMLEQLILRSLYELEEIPESIGEIMTLKFIQISDCSSGVNASAEKIQQEQQSWGNYELQLLIESSSGGFMIFSQGVRNIKKMLG